VVQSIIDLGLNKCTGPWAIGPKHVIINMFYSNNKRICIAP